MVDHFHLSIGEHFLIIVFLLAENPLEVGHNPIPVLNLPPDPPFEQNVPNQLLIIIGRRRIKRMKLPLLSLLPKALRIGQPRQILHKNLLPLLNPNSIRQTG